MQPAIFFNFDRTECERIASELLEELSTAETRWKETSGEWKRKLASWEKWKLQERDRRKEADKSRTRTVKKKQGDDTEGPTRDEEPVFANATWYASFDPDAVLPDFSFAGVSTGVDMEELEKELAHLLRRKHIEPWISDALLRGIGIHHAGMNKNYRGLIERCVYVHFGGSSGIDCLEQPIPKAIRQDHDRHWYSRSWYQRAD